MALFSRFSRTHQSKASRPKSQKKASSFGKKKSETGSVLKQSGQTERENHSARAGRPNRSGTASHSRSNSNRNNYNYNKKRNERQARPKAGRTPGYQRPKTKGQVNTRAQHKNLRINTNTPLIKGRIKKWGINGEGLGYHNKEVIFVEGAIPGELVEYSIEERKNSYATGKLKRILEPSPRRRVPLCGYSQECGACSLMHLDYRGQMQMKRDVLKETLRKYAGYKGEILPIIKNPSPLGYRNALKMPFGNKDHLQTGLYARNSNRFIGIEHCLIHAPKLEKVRKEITRLALNYNLPLAIKNEDGLITLVLKEYNDQVYAILVTGEIKLPEEFVEEVLNLEDVAGLWQSIKNRNDPDYELYGKKLYHLGGEMEMSLDLEDLSLSLLPRSFFQLNTHQALKLYQTVVEWIGQAKTVVEAYCGVGAISLFAADQAENVIGIDIVEDAIENARENALSNGKENVRFICGDAGKELKKLAGDAIDVLVLDPPRKGIDETMKKAIFKARPKKILYVSCNPATLAKDIKDLDRHYEILRVQPFDLFSQTSHIETLVELQERASKS